MMPTESDPRLVEWIIGGLFIGFYAYKRYNTSSYTGIADNRSSTTFFRFSSFFVFYLLALLVIYWIFGSFLQTSPEVFKNLWPMITGTGQPMPDFGAELTHFTGPMVSALMLTTLLPALPILQTFDGWLLRRFWDLGHIPSHVFRQSEKLRRAPLTLSPSAKDAIRARAEYHGIPQEALTFEESDSLEANWARLCHLMLELDTWQRLRGSRYMRYLQDNETEFDELKLDFARISRQLSNYAQQSATLQGDRESDSQTDSAQLLKDLGRTLMGSVREQYKHVCTLIARAICAVELTEKARRNTLAQMGFEQDAVRIESLTPSQVFTLAFWVAVVFTAVSVSEAYLRLGNDIRLMPIIFLAVIMTASYGAAAMAGILPKSIWSFADIEQSERRSFWAYFLSAILAVLFSLIAIVSIRYTFNAIDGLDPKTNTEKVINSLKWSHPYLLQSAVIGSVVAVLADIFPGRAGKEWNWIRRIDASTLCLAMMLASFLTYAWMEGLGPFQATRDEQYLRQANPFLFVAKGATVGLVIGLLVPSWYRKNRMRTPMQRLSRILSRQGGAVAREAGQLQSGKFKDALIVVAASVAAADGRVDPIEQHIMRHALFKLMTVGATDFTIDDATEEFAHMASRLSTGEHLDESLAPLGALRGHALLCEVVFQVGLAVACADGMFSEAEHKAIASIAEPLNLDPREYLVYA